MTPANSLLVGYERVSITQTLPISRKGAVWAEPSMAEAARAMRWVYEHPAEAQALGRRACAEVSQLLSMPAAGQRMARRLEAIRVARRQGGQRHRGISGRFPN